MDQDAFRQLLVGSRRSQPNAKQAVPAAVNKPQKATTSTSSEPDFKPRKVKNRESRYRDRAAERRDGVGNDYADVEAVLEDFEKRVAHQGRDVVEQQRKYLGGDSQYTILVKGLDLSLLEQNRARAAIATEDDEILEQAFAEATSVPESSESRKPTREDIIRDLKAKRQSGDSSVDQSVAVEKSVGDASALEVAKKAGKFRPIGFKPVGQTEERSKRRKGKEGKDSVKKKKQKVEGAPQDSGTNSVTKPSEEAPVVSQERSTIEPLSSKTLRKPPEAEPTTLGDDFDIFVGAGDYEGFPADEESEGEQREMEETRAASVTREATSPAPVAGTKGWFGEPEDRQASIPPEKSPPPASETMAIEDEPQTIHLEPLESSALPSIRDFLAIDEAAEKAEKRKARKEKKKKKKAGSDDD